MVSVTIHRRVLLCWVIGDSDAWENNLYERGLRFTEWRWCRWKLYYSCWLVISSTGLLVSLFLEACWQFFCFMLRREDGVFWRSSWLHYLETCGKHVLHSYVVVVCFVCTSTSSYFSGTSKVTAHPGFTGTILVSEKMSWCPNNTFGMRKCPVLTSILVRSDCYNETESVPAISTQS